MATGRSQVWRRQGRGATSASSPAILGAMETVSGSRSGVRRYVHPAWVVDYSFSDAGVYRAESREGFWCNRPAGEGHLYPPGFTYWEDMSECPADIHSAWIAFTHGNEAGLERLTRERGYAVVQDPDRVLGEAVSQAAQAWERSTEASLWRARAMLYEAIALLLEAEPVAGGLWRVGHAGGGPRSDFVRSVDAYLLHNIGARVTLSSVARACHVSLSALTHGYRRETGITPIAKLTQLRIARAKALLLRGYKLAYVAAETGFCDMYHLSKTFKRHEGVSPRQFVRLQRE
ncbi:MAG: helix-turn-helix domain-containing protein [Chitinivibrionales bacterium]|nr:helix-turn-helix domain-containing protein [Chitinivibrionales bacterium]